MIPRRAIISLKQQATTVASRNTSHTISRCSITPPLTNSSINTNPNFFLSTPSLSQNQKRYFCRYLVSCSSSPWISVNGSNGCNVLRGLSVRCLSTRSMNDSSSNRPPKETILLDGCDFEHWLVVMEPPDPNLTRDDIIDSYIKTLSQVLSSEEEARKQIYSVSTKHYFAFGCIVSEELSYKIKELPRVRWVLPDSYLDVKNKSYGGEPFVDGQAVPYDPKYHEEWVRNNARANERSRRNDRPRNYDRSRNIERRRENMMNRDMAPPPPPLQSPQPMPNPGFQSHGAPNREMPPAPGQDFQRRSPQSPMPNQGFSNRDMPPPIQNQGFQNRGMPPPMQNQDFQNRGMPPPMQNRDFQNGCNAPPMENQDVQNRNMPPPTQNWNFQSRDMPPPSQNQGFQNRNMLPPVQNQEFQHNYTPPPMQNRDVQNRDVPQMMLNGDFQGRGMPPPAVHNRDFQRRDMPPTMQNREFQNRDIPPPTQTRDFQNRDIPPPIHNQNFQNMDMRPPVQNQDFQYRDVGAVPNRDYQNRDMSMGGMPNRDYQSRDIAGDITDKESMVNMQSRDMPGNMNMGNTPTRDYQARDIPNENYKPMENKNF